MLVGSTALSVGVIAEALFCAFLVRGVARRELEAGDPASPPLRGRPFAAFYVPLALTPVIVLLIQPLGTAAISRMPEVVSSLAVWPVVIGLAFVFQSVGLAFAEVVVALLPRPGAREVLWRFALTLAGAVTRDLGRCSPSPRWPSCGSRGVAGLSDELTELATFAFAVAVPIPAARVLQSWYQGLLVAARRTRPIH